MRLDRMQLVIEADTDDFEELCRIAELDGTKDLRFADLAGVDFGHMDISGFDFTGADMSGCDLRNAKNHDKAIFGDAEIAGAIWLTDFLAYHKSIFESFGERDDPC